MWLISNIIKKYNNWEENRAYKATLSIFLCNCHGLNEIRQTVFKNNHKSIESRFPVSNRHGPFFRGFLNSQVNDLFGRTIG